MAEYVFLSEAGTKIRELEPGGAHTAAQSREKGETDSPVGNPAAAARLEEMLREFGFSVDNLELEVEKETLRISGRVRDQETREKVILAVGNIQGISKVVEQLAVEKEAAEALFYTVERADSLEAIAEKLLGDPSRRDEIVAANAPLLGSKKGIDPGRVLRIPGRE